MSRVLVDPKSKLKKNWGIDEKEYVADFARKEHEVDIYQGDEDTSDSQYEYTVSSESNDDDDADLSKIKKEKLPF
jgi:hypothetical protein